MRVLGGHGTGVRGLGYPPIPLFDLKVTLDGIVCRLIKYVNM